MKLLFIRDFFDYGGASKMIISVAEAMSNIGHESYVYAYGSESCPLDIPNKVQYIKGSPYIRNRALRHLLKVGEIRKVIKYINPDLIVTFMPYPSILTMIAKLGLKKKIVISERGDPAIYGGFIKLFGHKIISRADGAVFQTEGARDFYSGRLHDRSVIIPNAITIRRSKRIPWNERENQIAFVGRFFNQQKRQDLMVKAFSKIAPEFPNLTLVFYGDGEDMDKIKRQVDEAQLSDKVIFAGSVSPIESFIKNAKMYVLSSDYEGIPNSLIEAMCVGLPCVATDCTPGGARLLIDNEKNGFLVPKGDAQAIADKCLKILADPESAELMGIMAQDICERLAPEVIYPRWNEYLSKIVSGK